MADIRLRIEVNPNAETETLGTITNKVRTIIGVVAGNYNLSNVSFKTTMAGEYTDTSNVNENGREMLSWANNGILKFNSEGYLSNTGTTAGKLASEINPDMFVWGAVPATKKYSVILTFSNASSLKDIVIYGDKTANQFPTRAVIDGEKVVYSDDYKWAINMETEKSTHTIEFTDWNRANYNACLTKIMVMLRYFDLDKSWIDSVESLSQSTSDPSSIQYGVLANSGSANIRDLDGEIEDYIKDGIIDNSNVPIQLLINGNLVQTHITTDSNYSNDKIFSIEISNELPNWGYNEMPEYALGDSQSNLYLLFKAIMTKFGYSTTYIDNMCSKIIRNNKTAKEIMQDIIIKFPYIKSTNLREFINKICTLCQFYLYNDNNGLPYFREALPIYSDETIIKIPTYLQTNRPVSDIITKNKYNNVSYIENSIEMEIKDICNQTLYLRDSDGNFSISNINGASIKTINDINYLCFFIECNENCEYIYSATGNPNIQYPYNSVFTNNDGSQIGAFSVAIGYNTSDTKDTFSFENAQSSCTQLAKYDTLNSSIFAIKEALPSNYSTITEKIYISIFAECFVKTSNKKNINNNTNTFNLEDNEFLCIQNTINDNDCYQEISNNILSYYANGIKTCNLQIMCQDMYSTTGEKMKDWSKGEILEVGDLVRVDKDNDGNSQYTYPDGSPIIFRVTGSKFSYNGSPKLDLELQEVK